VNQLVFLDEFGATTTMQRTHGRAAPGRTRGTKVPHGHWKMISSIAAMNVDGIVASCSFDGATDTDYSSPSFARRWCRSSNPSRCWCWITCRPTNRRRSIGSLKRPARECCGCRHTHRTSIRSRWAISKVKTVLRKFARRSVDGLFAGIGEALGSIRPTDALNYIAHCGYARKRRNPL